MPDRFVLMRPFFQLYRIGLYAQIAYKKLFYTGVLVSFHGDKKT